MKYFICLLLVIAGWQMGLVEEVWADERGEVIIINQVRGERCCGEGSVENLEFQLKLLEEKDLKGFFLLRYDALKNEEMMGLVNKYWQKGVISPGVLMEVIPGLVDREIYEKKGGEWYEARKVFSVGYGQLERKEIIDRLMSEFYGQFGFYPKIGGAWMVDGFSLDYMYERYGVEVFEITREQWGTDTYKLYGGMHYPYLASESWPLVPDFVDGKVLMVRQTISDPLYNYGDNSDSFTSQPNDYSNGGKNFKYFKALFDQVVIENESGWAVLGLENSMEERYQREFERQLEYVKELRDKKMVKVVSEIDQLRHWKKNEVRIYEGKDLINDESDQRVWWVESGRYRMRIRSDGEKVFIDDVRIYDDWQDPYWKEKVETEGVWVVPFLIDGSRWYKEEDEKLWWRGWFGPPEVEKKFKNVSSDVGSDPMRLVLGESNGVELKDGVLQWDGGKKKINFYKDHWVGEGFGVGDLEYVGWQDENYPVVVERDGEGKELTFKWLIDGEVSHWMKIEGEKQSYWSWGSREELWGQILEDHYAYAWPEPRHREVSGSESVVYAHNLVAVAGRNPVRLVVLLYDKAGMGVVNDMLEIGIKGEGIETNLISQDKRQVQLIDLYSEKPQKAEVELVLGNEVIKKTVWWAPNCKQNWKYCMTHSIKGWWYLRGVGGDWLRRVVLGESQ